MPIRILIGKLMVLQTVSYLSFTVPYAFFNSKHTDLLDLALSLPAEHRS